MSGAGGVWRFKIFGGVAAEQPDGPVVPLSGMPRLLLGLLLLKANRVVEADVLIDHLWRERLPKKPLNSLQQACWQLRAALGDQDQLLVATVGSGYVLRAQADAVDIVVFDRLVRAGLALVDCDASVAGVLLDAGLALAQGNLPDLHPDGCLSLEVERLNELREQATHLLRRQRNGLCSPQAASEFSDRLGWPSPPVTVVVRVTDLRPLELADSVNAVAARQGRVDRVADAILVATLPGVVAAVSVAQVITSIVTGSAGAGIELGRATEVVVERATRLAASADRGQILVSASVRDVAVDAGSSSVFEDVGDDLWQVGTSPAAGGRRRRECSFTGRDSEIATLVSLLSTGSVVTLRGPGGIGKTRLAREAAARLSGRFDDGVLPLDLATASYQGGALAAAMLQLGFSCQPYRSRLDTIVDRLARAKLLVILDNCEDFVTEVGELVEAILQGCPGVKMLLTSRTALGHPAEVVYEVGGLGVEAAEAMMCSLVTTPVGQALSETGAVRRLCERLGGMPLAIECAAPLVRSVGIEAALAALAERPNGTFLPVLDAARGGSGRHRTVEASLHASYRLLATDDALFFERLSSLCGPFDADDAVAAEPPSTATLVPERMARLEEASLISVTDSGRWLLLEPVRQYAATMLLRRGEVAAQAARHAEHFAALADRAAGRLCSPEEAVWFHRLSCAGPNLDAALSWATSAGDPAVALRLGSSLWWYWAAHGMFVEGAAAIERALAIGGEAPALLRAKALVADTHLSWWAGNPARTAVAATCVLDLLSATSPGDPMVPWLAGWARMGVAASRMWGCDDWEARIAMCHEAAELFAGIGDGTGVGLAWEVRSGLAWHQGDDYHFLEASGRGLTEFDAGGHQTMIAQALRVHGLALALCGETGRARELVDAGLDLSRRLGERGGLPLGLCFLGLVESLAGRPGGAAAAFSRSLKFNRAYGQVWPAVLGLSFGAEWAATGERAIDAVQLLAAAATLTDRTGIGLAPRERRRAAEADAMASAVLSEDQFRAARTAGAALSVARATDLALDVLSAGQG